MDTDIDLKLEAGVPTGVDNVSNAAGCGLLLSFHPTLRHDCLDALYGAGVSLIL